MGSGDLIKRIGTIITVGLSIFLGVWVFFLYQGDVALGQRFIYLLLTVLCVVSVTETTKWALVWIMRSLGK